MESFIESLDTDMPAHLRRAVIAGYRVCFESEAYNPDGVREATKAEYEDCHRKVIMNEAELHYPEPGPDRDKFFNECMDDCEHIWDIHVHAYTIDGTQLLVTVRNKDGSNYIYLVFVDEKDRGKGIGTMLIKQALKDSPNGISLHTSKNNDGAYALYKRLGFKEYPSVDDSERFMANVPGIGGNEWWEESEEEK